jgi:uncharacterized protein YllA (UPF0747 family)
VEAVLEAGRGRLGGGPWEETRKELAKCLGDYARAHGAGAASLEAAELLGEPGTVVVLAGHQPVLFGGPILVWNKIATALALSEEIRRLPGAPKVVTLFWNHSDDHDWGEANHCFLLNPNLDLQRVRVSLPASGKASCRVGVSHSLRDLLALLRELAPDTREAQKILDAFAPQDGETLGGHAARLFFRAFGDRGLLVLEPDALPERFFEPLRDWAREAEAFRADLATQAGELQDRGFEVTLHPEAPLFYEIGPEGKRRAVPDGLAFGAEGRPSPGALMRCLFQDRILPTLAYVAGPGELGYQALIQAFYRRMDLPRPVLVPRASWTLVEARLADWLERWNLSLSDLDQGGSLVEEKIVSREGGQAAVDEGPSRVLEELSARLARALAEIEPKVGSIDPKLLLPLDRFRVRTQGELERLAQKIRHQQRNLSGAWRKHARRLCVELRPRGELQERVLAGLQFYWRHGDSFPRGLVQVVQGLPTEHGLVRLEEKAPQRPSDPAAAPPSSP